MDVVAEVAYRVHEVLGVELNQPAVMRGIDQQFKTRSAGNDRSTVVAREAGRRQLRVVFHEYGEQQALDETADSENREKIGSAVLRGATLGDPIGQQVDHL